jgi:hypothetical protein
MYSHSHCWHSQCLLLGLVQAKLLQGRACKHCYDTESCINILNAMYIYTALLVHMKICVCIFCGDFRLDLTQNQIVIAFSMSCLMMMMILVFACLVTDVRG